jgi:hypothetical protein
MFREIYGEEPPCGTSECEKPAPLTQKNQALWYVWLLCSNYGRPAGEGIFPVDIKTVMDLCELYDCSKEDFEEIMYIEENTYPLLAKDYSDKFKAKMKEGQRGD